MCIKFRKFKPYMIKCQVNNSWVCRLVCWSARLLTWLVVFSTCAKQKTCDPLIYLNCIVLDEHDNNLILDTPTISSLSTSLWVLSLSYWTPYKSSCSTISFCNYQTSMLVLKEYALLGFGVIVTCIETIWNILLKTGNGTIDIIIIIFDVVRHHVHDIF